MPLCSVFLDKDRLYLQMPFYANGNSLLGGADQGMCAFCVAQGCLELYFDYLEVSFALLHLSMQASADRHLDSVYAAVVHVA